MFTKKRSSFKNQGDKLPAAYHYAITIRSHVQTLNRRSLRWEHRANKNRILVYQEMKGHLWLDASQGHRCANDLMQNCTMESNNEFVLTCDK